MLEIAFQLSPRLYGAPRTLALARSAQDLAAASGVFLPTSHHLLSLLELLHAREGRPCPSASAVHPATGAAPASSSLGEEGSEGEGQQGGARTKNAKGRGAGVAGARAQQPPAIAVDLSAVAGLGKEELRLGEVHAAVSRAATSLIAREAVCCYRWSAGLPELCAGVEGRLSKLLEGGCLPAEGGAGKCRARVKALQVTLGKASAEAVVRRARGSKHPGEAGPIDTFRDMVSFFVFCFPIYFLQNCKDPFLHLAVAFFFLVLFRFVSFCFVVCFISIFLFSTL